MNLYKVLSILLLGSLQFLSYAVQLSLVFVELVEQLYMAAEGIDVIL